LLPPVETIIKESIKVKLNEESLDRLKQDYKRLHAPKKEDKRNKMKKLGNVKQQAMMENIEKEQEQKKIRKMERR
jgi:hypothetical protein